MLLRVFSFYESSEYDQFGGNLNLYQDKPFWNRVYLCMKDLKFFFKLS